MSRNYVSFGMVSHILVQLLIHHISCDVAQLDKIINNLRRRLLLFSEKGWKTEMTMAERDRWYKVRRHRSDKLSKHENARKILRIDIERLQLILKEL